MQKEVIKYFWLPLAGFEWKKAACTCNMCSSLVIWCEPGNRPMFLQWVGICKACRRVCLVFVLSCSSHPCYITNKISFCWNGQGWYFIEYYVHLMYTFFHVEIHRTCWRIVKWSSLKDKMLYFPINSCMFRTKRACTALKYYCVSNCTYSFEFCNGHWINVLSCSDQVLWWRFGGHCNDPHF